MSNNLKPSFVKVGFVQGAHGIRGELFVKIPSQEFAWLKELKHFALEPREATSSPLEMSLEKAKPHKDGLIIKAKEIPDRNRAEELKGYSFLIPEHFLISQPGETIFLRELLNFEVLSGDEKIGRVVGFMDNGAHDLLRVQDDKDQKKEHLIPFVEAFILDISFEDKRLKMILPEGLIE